MIIIPIPMAQATGFGAKPTKEQQASIDKVSEMQKSMLEYMRESERKSMAEREGALNKLAGIYGIKD